MPLDRSTIMRINRGVGVVGLVAGIVVAWVAAAWTIRTRAFIATAAPAQGQVIVNQPVVWQDRDSHGASSSTVTRTSYRAVVRFTDGAGRSIILRDTIAFNPPSFAVGQRVPVLYDPQRPARALIDRGARLYLVPGVAGVFAALMVLGSLQRLFDRRLAADLNPPAVPYLPAA